MLTVSIGQVVVSTAGKDKGKLSAVVAVTEQAVWLADGKRRILEHAKSKNPRHVVPTETRLSADEMATNRGLRHALRALESEQQ